MKYNAKIRIPTDQYAFIEIDHEGEPYEIVDIYNQFKNQLNPQGIETKQFNQAIDEYLTNGTMVSEVYENMSQTQKGVIQEIKKSVKRLKNKETC